MTSNKRKPRSEYLPTLEEISSECRKIQAGWSEDTYRIRAGSTTKAVLRKELAWTPMTYTEKEIAKTLGYR